MKIVHILMNSREKRRSLLSCSPLAVISIPFHEQYAVNVQKHN